MREFSLKNNTMEQIAIQGIAGCYHETAARRYFSDRTLEVLPCSSFDRLFACMSEDPKLLGIAAIENTIAGSLLPTTNSSSAAVPGSSENRNPHLARHRRTPRQTLDKSEKYTPIPSP